MEETEAQAKEPHPFEQFKAVMKKLIEVPKSELDAKLKEHNETKPKRSAGRKSTKVSGKL